jgi:putative SOS response-associated peptidase YedK
MTARFFRREIPWDELTARTGLVPPPGVDTPEAQYNIAPTQIAPIIRPAPDGEYTPRDTIQMAPAVWGLIPVWWNKPLSEKKFTSFSARAETIDVSRTFSGSFRQGRCLVPASGFYVWRQAGSARSTPFAVTPKDGGWVCFAGLWSRWMHDGSEIDTFAIVTVEPNAVLTGLSTSMPAILEPSHYARWLDVMDRDPLSLLMPLPSDRIEVKPAHPSVGNVRNQGPELPGDEPDEEEPDEEKDAP